MPLIRYKLRDVGILDNESCSCGISFQLLKSVEGRVVDCFTLSDGRVISPKTIMTTVQSTPGVSRYQVVQESMNKVTIELIGGSNDQNFSIDDLISRCRKIFNEDTEIKVFNGSLENLKVKFRPVISKLTINEEPRWTKTHI